MFKLNDSLPQCGSDLFLTDGGLETFLIFHENFDLPHFAAFVLLEDARGRFKLREYYRKYLDIASGAGSGFILESPTWRANPDWGRKLGYNRNRLTEINRRAIDLMSELRAEFASNERPVVLSGTIGPRGDGYVPGELMTEEQAADYHELQVQAFADKPTDMITAMTLSYPEEAIGIVNAGKNAGIPVVIGFTTETDGKLPNGQTLRSAIEQVDEKTGEGPAYYMINCAHSEHFSHVLDPNEPWTQRIRGIRANASRLSHAELDECEVLDDGDPGEFGTLYRELKNRFPALVVFGGCCGTDYRHLDAVQAVLARSG